MKIGNTKLGLWVDCIEKRTPNETHVVLPHGHLSAKPATLAPTLSNEHDLGDASTVKENSIKHPSIC